MGSKSYKSGLQNPTLKGLISNSSLFQLSKVLHFLAKVRLKVVFYPKVYKSTTQITLSTLVFIRVPHEESFNEGLLAVKVIQNSYFMKMCHL
jgi:hypothetical protein